MNIDRCCNCSSICDPDAPACLVVTLSGIEMQRVCSYATNGGTVSTLNAVGFNRSFKVPLFSAGTPNIYAATFPAFLYRHASFFSGTSEEVQYSEEIEVYIEASCSGGVLEIQQLSVGFTNYSISGTSPAGYIVSDSLFALPVGTTASLDQVIENEYSDGPGCSLGGVETHDYFGGGQAFVTAPSTCPDFNDYAICEHCGGTLDPIVVDLADLPGSIVQAAELDEELYFISEYTNDGTPETVTFVDDSCDETQWNVCYRCDGLAGSITVDFAALPPGTQTVRYDDIDYFITSKLSPAAPVTVEAFTTACPGAISRIGRRCDGGPEEVSYDPATQDPGSYTFFFEGHRYYPTILSSTLPPQLVLWSPLGCNTGGPRPTNPCFDPACQFGSPNFPGCCAQSQWISCPQCFTGLTLQQQSKMLRRVSGQPMGVTPKKKGPRKRGLISEAELEAMGFDPEAEARAAKQGGCCGRPSD